MRALVDAGRIRVFMRELGRATGSTARVYFAGGATAVLSEWRPSTIDVDLKLVPDDDALLRAIPAIKESLQINVELASPDDFIPVRPGWEDRSPFITREGTLFFHHFDLVAQALAKIERGHAQDREDVLEMLRRGLVGAEDLRSAFDAIAPQLYRYPALDPAGFRKALDAMLEDART
jgi:non-ribosomal peptide synthetase component F